MSTETSPAYEVVIGLEVHAQLSTQSKLFSPDSTRFGAPPNSQVSPLTLAHPGTLPVLNETAVAFAIRAGLACGCTIARYNYFARKNYFYPDLPKGYQISQHTVPICLGGQVPIRIQGLVKPIVLNRIHLEEDAGKSSHDLDEAYSSIDLNRAGVPLIEIVTEPVLASSEEAYQFLTELRKLLRHLDVCDGNMEEGSMRCDANISVRPAGSQRLGTKVEVKNLNSIRNVKRAIEYEAQRMIGLLQEGKPIVQQTRSFDAQQGNTFALRTKEEANDYRYFPDPDLPPFEVSDAFLQEIHAAMPRLPEERVADWRSQYQLSEYDARVLCEEKEDAEFFEALARQTPHYKAAANWMMGPLRSLARERGVSIGQLGLSPSTLGLLIDLVESGALNFSTASSRLLPALLEQPGSEPATLARSLGLVQDGDSEAIRRWVEEALARMPDKVDQYRKGKKGLLGLFVGEVKKISMGKADPRLTNQILLEKLEPS